ncbi:transcription factor bHLH130-like [Vicia villosa]|uniref:transcription factor bHLH130-like n=1 Tax=Vicia villosa TaxID=3911 RepID=UPI00273ADC16|nr:transcription factor bHLH130-like [Vicia villosa]
MDLNSGYQELQQNQRLLRFRSTSSSGASSSMIVGSSMGMDQPSGSSAGHFSNNIISFENGYDTTKGVENYDGVNESDGELTLSMSILKNQIGFLPNSSSLGTLSQNSKMGSDGHKFFYDYNHQNVEVGNQVNTLSHHMSLPRKSSEMFVMENLHQFPDSSVPSSIRAKRGCATHPRSVAERVRRTRISDRMKKLQELVPNIDKQTCTSEMLELAAEYIKDLQKQLKIMSAKRAKCRCKNQK